jgi:FMN-dependent dehydrogenase
MSTKPVNVEDYRILAQRRLPRIIFDYLEGGSDDETGLRHNHEVFERYRLMPRRLVVISSGHLGGGTSRLLARSGVSLRRINLGAIGVKRTFRCGGVARR